MRLANAALDSLEATVKTEAIACDWARAGKYHAAVTERGANETLKPFIAALDGLGEPYRVLDRRRVGGGAWDVLLSRDGLYAELRADKSGRSHAWPCRHAPGQCHAATRTVRSLRMSRGPHRYGANSGRQLRAPRMILAVNAFAEKFGYWTGRLLPFSAQASLTRPFTESEHASIGSCQTVGHHAGQRLRVDHRALYHRSTHPDPLSHPLLPNARRMSEVGRRRAHDLHRAVLIAAFPASRRCRSTTPGRAMSACRATMPRVSARSTTNVWSAVCQNAVGVTKGTIAGMLAADLACSVDNPLIADMESLGTPARLPPRPFLDIGVQRPFRMGLMAGAA